MTDPLFFTFIAISVLSFGTHGALLVHFARRFDPLVVAAYRGVSLIVTMAPLLLFVSWGEIVAVKDHSLMLLLSASIGSIAFVMSMSGSRYLPVGVASSIRQTVNVPVAIVIGMLFLQEYLTLVQIVLLAGIAGCAIGLTTLRSHHPHLDPEKALRGVLFSVCAGVGGALSWYFFSLAARELHPFVAAYFVEVSVGLFTLLYFIMLRMSRQHTSTALLPPRAIRNIVLIGALTIFGTGGYAIAINHGPFPLGQGLMTGTILVATGVAWFLFKERLNKKQIGLIIGAVILMFLLKVVS